MLALTLTAKLWIACGVFLGLLIVAAWIALVILREVLRTLSER